jgi:ataxia telangiectasia mutated family protein
MHQMAARMSLKGLNSYQQSINKENNEEDKIELKAAELFQKCLIDLILKIAQEHPHHSLSILFAFANSNKDYLIQNTTTVAANSNAKKRNSDSNSSEMNTYLMTEDRVNTASFILNRLKLKSENLKSIIDQMSTLFDAYIELANAQMAQKPKSNESITFPRSLLINKIKNFTQTNVVTNSMPVRPDGNYDESKLIYIIKFDNKFKIANGVNMPKIVNCYGSDGFPRKQLVKGKDDLRQDAIMQQFFATVNDIINHNNSLKNTTKLNTIRTYKIVPLSKKSGVLEWCQNTSKQDKHFLRCNLF